MKLVFVYGPPAVGKLTVAQELAKLTGYRLFHSHLTVDMVESLFPRTTPQYRPILRKYRLYLVEEAAKAKVNFIMTFAYYSKEPGTIAWVRSLTRVVKKHGGQVCFVRLICEYKELAKRVKHPSRAKFGKIKTLSLLNERIVNAGGVSEVPGVHSFTLDNTKLSAKKTAHLIKKHFKL